MSFFDSIPQPPPPPDPVRRRRPAWMRPEAVIPGSAPGEAVLIRTDEVAVAVGSVRAYPNGFEFTVHVRLRREDETSWPGHSDVFQRPRPGPEGDGSQLRLGILYPDGRRAATTGGHWRPTDHDDDGRLLLQQGGGGGGSRGSDWDFWVHPLPPPGLVALVASWRHHGIAESRAELDGAAIRAAAGRAVSLWPEEQESESGGSWRSGRITGHHTAQAEPGQPGAEGTASG
ncbi:MAG TPA: hypothetical protein VK802_14095 [Streptosporangiaceae bacterium]|jgi:hypothetical protein|nr:hypothetical protein [Streptosporangiaceae bacterium]